jgi:hypothetical protein
MVLSGATPARAATRINVMPDRQVRPGVSLPVFGSADGGTGLANGQNYTWAFGANPDVQVITDGNLSGLIGNDKFIVENVTFNLLNGSTREVIVATLTVGGLSKSVNIDIVDGLPAPAADISDSPLENLAVNANIDIEDGLRAMYLDQLATGRWRFNGPASGDFQVRDCATTAFSVWAFSNSGHRPTNSITDDIYAEWVQKGVSFILTLSERIASPAPGAANALRLTQAPDGNANGTMLSLCGGHAINSGHGGLPGEEGYANGVAAAAVIAAWSASKNTTHTAPVGGLANQSYFNIIQDAVDWISVAAEDNVGVERGGWRYDFEQGADTSADSWNYVALEGHEQVFGGTVLEDVKKESEIRIHASQNNNGQFGYVDTNCLAAGCNATTGGGLSGLVMVTSGGRNDNLDTAPFNTFFGNAQVRKDAAVTHLGANWHVAGNTWQGNMPNFYAMWTQARALRLNGTTQLLNQGTTFNWETGDTTAPGEDLPPAGDPQEGYFQFLTRTQAADGHWAGTVNAGNWTQPLNTAWGVLILQPRVFPAPCVDNNNNGICDSEEQIVCDVDNDRDVDGADLLIIRQGNGQTSTPPGSDPRDANADGRINVADYRYCQLRLTPPPGQ